MKDLATLSTITMILVTGLIFGACGPKSPGEEVPEKEAKLPPLRSLHFDMSLFENGPQVPQSDDLRTRWRKTDSLAAFWTEGRMADAHLAATALDSLMARPEPIYFNEKQAYLWQGDFTFRRQNFISDLQAQYEGDFMLYRLFISSGTGEAFLWMEGKASPDQSVVDWSIYGSSSTRQSQLKVSYKYYPLDSNYILTYRDSVSKNYFSYRSAGMDSVANYELYFNGEGELYNIDWHLFDYKGYLVTPDKDTLCWDHSYYDVPCDSEVEL